MPTVVPVGKCGNAIIGGVRHRVCVLRRNRKGVLVAYNADDPSSAWQAKNKITIKERDFA